MLADAEYRPHQLVQAVVTCDDADLDAWLRTSLGTFPGVAGRLFVALTRDRGVAMWAAFQRLAGAGFAMGAAHLELMASPPPQPRKEENLLPRLPPPAPSLADFELVALHWAKLSDKSKAIFADGCLGWWASAVGADTPSATLLRLRPVWSHARPTQRRKLPPARACGLDWPCSDTLALLAHVDLDGDTAALVGELLKRDALPYAFVAAHQGLIAGALIVRPDWAVARLLAGEIALVKPQLSLALLAACALERAKPELTKQAVKHLGRFIDELEHVQAATNAMAACVEPLLTLLARLPPDERAPLLARLSRYYVTDTGSSAMAAVPRSADERAGSGRDTTAVHSFERLFDAALRFVSLDELVGVHALSVCKQWPVSPAVRVRFEEWVMKQLKEPQQTTQLLALCTDWLPVLCAPDQMLRLWLQTLSAAKSWSFTLCSAVPIAAACGGPDDERVPSQITQLLRLEKSASAARREGVLCALAHGSPRFFAKEYSICQWIKLSKRPPVQPKLLPRTTRAATGATGKARRGVGAPTDDGESAACINDSLRADLALNRNLAATASMHRTKTREEFLLLSDWVTGLETRLLADRQVAERFGAILCAAWSDRAALSQLCDSFSHKLLVVALAAHDASALVAFVAKCPHLPGGSKLAYLATRLLPRLPVAAAEAAAEAGAAAGYGGLAARPTASPQSTALLDSMDTIGVLEALFAAHASSAVELNELLSAAGAAEAPGAAESLCLALVARAPTADARVYALKALPAQLRVRAPSVVGDRDECIDIPAWVAACAQAEPKLPARPGAGAAAGAVAGAAVELVAVPMEPGCGLFARFGQKGQELVYAFLETPATPQQLAALLGDDETWRATCRAAVVARWWPACSEGAASPSKEAEDEVGCLLAMVGWYPELRTRCLPLIWARGTDEQIFRAQRGKTLDLDVLPRRLWHCIDWARASDAELARLAGAGVAVPLEKVDVCRYNWPTQQLLLNTLATASAAASAADTGGAQGTTKPDGVQREASSRAPGVTHAQTKQQRVALARLAELDACATHAPQAKGPIGCYLTRAFELLASPSLELLLASRGDGVGDSEKLASGRNKILHTLLVSVRERAKAGNALHSSEQRILFAGCARRGHLLEAKHVDETHVAAIVRHVLECAEGTFHTCVRDSALRAMLRLGPRERDELHCSLLDGAAMLPLQTLFALSVTTLCPAVVPLVSAQLQALSPERWEMLLTLIRDANPAGEGRAPHTFPRSLRAVFNERFLRRYLRGEYAPQKPGPSPAQNPPACVAGPRDVRFFQLWSKCTEPNMVAAQVLAVLASQRHALEQLLLDALAEAPLSLAQLVELAEYVLPGQWTSILGWFLACVRALSAPLLGRAVLVRDGTGASASGDGDGLASGVAVGFDHGSSLYRVELDAPGAAAVEQGASALRLAPGQGHVPLEQCAPRAAELFGCLLQVLSRPELSARQVEILSTLLGPAHATVTRELLRCADVRRLLRERLPPTDAQRGAATPSERALWISFFGAIWTAGARYTHAELSCTLALDKSPLTNGEVHALGTDAGARELLIAIAPAHALPLYGFAVLSEHPSFAASLSNVQLSAIAQLRAENDADWPVCRMVVMHVRPPAALRLAISLLKHSREPQDLVLLTDAFVAADSFTRKQHYLPRELSCVWEAVGPQLQQAIDSQLAANDEAMAEQLRAVSSG
ncbi:hypothetical protein T492DRAFT_1139741 [Pavlovales sp. CCMP2436]|nr:hypothetical protein T492DRAFT_1139741 [Pavlovales sp. CCMP2436]